MDELVSNNHRPLRDEFYIFWNSGFSETEYVEGSAAICTIVMDKGETNLTRIFSTEVDDTVRADEHLVEWLNEHPLILESNDIEMKIHLNYSPQEATAHALINFVHSLEEQQKQIKVTVKFVQLYKTDNDEEAEENRQGLRKLKDSGFGIDVFHEGDWFFLAEILADKRSRKTQMLNGDKTKHRLRLIFKDPRDEASVTESVTTSEIETMTEKPVVCNNSDSSSDSES